MLKKGNGLNPFLTQVISMTTCPFNNLSACEQQFFLRGGGDCTLAIISVLVQKTHINRFSIVQNQGIIGAKHFITLGKSDRV